MMPALTYSWHTRYNWTWTVHLYSHLAHGIEGVQEALDGGGGGGELLNPGQLFAVILLLALPVKLLVLSRYEGLNCAIGLSFPSELVRNLGKLKDNIILICFELDNKKLDSCLCRFNIYF